MTTVSSIHNINEQLVSTLLKDGLIELETVDAQPSHVNGVLILVTGSSTTDAVKRKFTQSFFLAPQGNEAYFVLNDVLRIAPAVPITERNEVITNHGNESKQSATLLAEPDKASVKESRVSNLPSAKNIPVNGEVISPSANGTTPAKNDTGVKTFVKEVNEDVEKIPEADPNPALAAKDVKKTPEAASTASAKKDAEKISEAAPTPASSEKDVPKKTYASIVKVMMGSPPPAPSAKPKPRPKAAQNTEKSASLPPKPAHATNTEPSGDKNISNNKPHDGPGYSIFVKNLPYNATVEMIEQEFRKFGAIKPGGIQVRNRQPDRFCFGFVEFESEHSMRAAIEASPVCFGLRESYVEEKRTTTRVVNGVVVSFGDDSGNAVGNRFQPGRGGYHGDSFHQNGNGYHQNGNGYQQRRPVQNGNGPRQTPSAP